MSEPAAPSPLLPVSAALARLLTAARFRPIGTEEIVVGEADGRVLAAELVARRDQPPFAMSSMDGFALRAAETQSDSPPLRIIGESAAGHPFAGAIAPGEAIRIFTGAAMPEGADAVLIQENAHVEAEHVQALVPATAGQFIRQKGRDFRLGDTGLAAGETLDPRKIAFAAAMNHPVIRVTQRPRIALLTTGDELVMPGADAALDRTIASNVIGIAAQARAAGALVAELGIAADTRESVRHAIGQALEGGFDLLVTIGGASVGKHDLVRPVLAEMGARLDFYRIAMRPGKPLNFGSLDEMLVLGLPGNPVSAMVCATLFLVPLIRALQADSHAGEDRTEPAILGKSILANDMRQDYLRARLVRDEAGQLVAEPFADQDSALASVFARADALLLREPHAPAAEKGAPCRILRL